MTRDLQRRLDRVAPWLAAALLLVLYGPVLRMGPVGEDYQWAYKGWISLRHPGGWRLPFHQHFRPAGRLFFMASANLFGDRWFLYRLVVLCLAAVLGVLAWRFLRRSVGLGPLASAAALLAWLGSPFADEVFFVTNQVKQILYVIGVLLVLTGRRPEGRGRPMLVVGGALLAFAAKEEAVVLVALVFLQDRFLFRLPIGRAIRRAAPWAMVTTAYLILYKLLVHFEAGWFYATPWMAAPNLALTWTAFWHLHPPVLGRFLEAIARLWPLAALAGAVTVAALVHARRRGDGVVPFGFAAAVVALAPTLPANLQVPRYTFLADLLFLVAVLAAAEGLLEAGPRRVLVPALAFAFLAVAANDILTVRGDRVDWERYAALSRRLEGETRPVLAALRSGRAVVAIRGADGGPLREILRNLEGGPKLFFPRPDDPYGVVSLSAVVTWRLRNEGIAAPRAVDPGDPGPARFLLHEPGGFREIGPVPAALAHPFGEGVVVLRPVPSAEFDPNVFP